MTVASGVCRLCGGGGDVEIVLSVSQWQNFSVLVSNQRVILQRPQASAFIFDCYKFITLEILQ